MTRNVEDMWFLTYLLFPNFFCWTVKLVLKKELANSILELWAWYLSISMAGLRQTTRITGRTADIPFQCRPMDLLKITCWTLDLLNIKRWSFGLLNIQFRSLNPLSTKCLPLDFLNRKCSPLDLLLIILPLEPEVLTHWTSKTWNSYHWISWIYSASNWTSWT
jgi:hypothetical protein